jgi:hypothetical protein
MAASAAFALATALGAALGPGMAIILDLFDFEFCLPGFGKQTFNGMTWEVLNGLKIWVICLFSYLRLT